MVCALHRMDGYLMEEIKVQTFLDLHEEVVSKGLCGQCGGCVSFCSAGGLHALEVDEDGFPRYADEEKCLRCGLCYLICPVTKELEDELREKFDWRPPIGTYQTITSARATDPSILEAATDGGVVTALLTYMLERGIVEGAIVSKKISAFGRQPAIATTTEELIAAAGSHFSASSHLEQLGAQYTTYSPTIAAVKDLTGQRLRRVALVGTPCQINTVRKMQCLSILPADVITHTIGLFCMENFIFNGSAGQELLHDLGITLDDIAKLNVKEDLILTLNDGSTIHVPFERADALARPACLACGEFANDYADIAVGGLGSPDGYTTTLIRTAKGRTVFEEALSRGYLEERTFSDSFRMNEEKAKMLGKVMEFAQRKRERAEARLNGG